MRAQKIEVAVEATFQDAREGLKSAHRRAKPHLIGKLFNEDILSTQNWDFGRR